MASEASWIRAFQLSYLLVGEVEGAAEALLETVRLHGVANPFPWEELVQAAMRRADGLSPDRFFLRSLRDPEGLVAQVDRLPGSERTALVLDAAGALSTEQIAGLLRLPPGALGDLLTRLWRGIGVGRSDLWAALQATVPSVPAGFELRLEATLAGDEPGSVAAAPGKEPRQRRLALTGTLLLSALALLLSIRWWPSPVELRPAEEEAIVITVPESTTSLDLTPYKAGAVIRLSTGGAHIPTREGLDRIAYKVLQWLGEAEVIGEDPAATPGTTSLSLRLRFADDDLDLWLVAPDACMTHTGPCPVTVGGASTVPLKVEQADLGRWMAGSGWVLDLNPAEISLLESRSDRRMSPAEVVNLSALVLPEGSVVEVRTKDRLVIFRDQNGQWRTGGEPVWWLFIHPDGDPTEGEFWIIDDRTGSVLNRTSLGH